MKKQHESDLSFLQSIIRKVLAWLSFPGMLRMDEFGRKVGFNDEQTKTLIGGKPIKFYSKTYRK